MPIVINTETKGYSFDGLNIRTFNTKKAIPWGRRLIGALKSIETKYILFALEDFYLEDRVDSSALDKCIGYMEENPEVAVFSFYPTEDENNIPSNRYLGFEKRPQRGEYRLNCQIAVWNREKLISFIRPHESPWEWELYGSRRSARYKEEFYSIAHGEDLPFKYSRGAVIMRGRWWIEKVEPLNEKYALGIDYTARGSYEDYIKSSAPRKRSLLRGIKNRINIIRSLI